MLDFPVSKVKENIQDCYENNNLLWFQGEEIKLLKQEIEKLLFEQKKQEEKIRREKEDLLHKLKKQEKEILDYRKKIEYIFYCKAYNKPIYF